MRGGAPTRLVCQQLDLFMAAEVAAYRSFRTEYKPRRNLCMHEFSHPDYRDDDVDVLDGWKLARETHPACAISEAGMWLPVQWLDGRVSKNLATTVTPRVLSLLSLLCVWLQKQTSQVIDTPDTFSLLSPLSVWLQKQTSQMTCPWHLANQVHPSVKREKWKNEDRNSRLLFSVMHYE